MRGNGIVMAAEEPPPSYDAIIPLSLTPVEEIGSSQAKKRSEANGDASGNGHVADAEPVAAKTDEPTKKAPTEVVSLSTLFKYADGLDWLMMVFGTLGALVHGAAMPIMILLFGKMIDSFVDVGQFCQNCNDTDVDKIQVFNYTYSGLVQAVAAGYRIDTNGSSSCSAFSNFSGAMPYFLNRLGYTCSQLIKSDTVATDLQSFLNTNVSAELKTNVSGSSCGGSSFTQSQLLSDMHTYSLYYIAIACSVFLSGYLQVGLWSLAAHRQAHRIKLGFFRSILRQDMSWFDTSKSGELSTRLADDIDKIQDGIGDKLGTFFQWVAASIAGIVVSFSFGLGWKLTLVVLACSPLLVVGAMIMAKVTSDVTSKEQKAYARAGGVAEEVLSSIRTVAAFGGQKKESTRYSECLKDAKEFGIKKGVTTGMGLGFVFFVIFAAYALGFWYGTTLVIAKEINVGTMVVVFFCVIIAAFSLGNAAPNIRNLATARGAAFTVYQIIDRVPVINSESQEGEQPKSTNGSITFRDVHFNYPSRPDVKVLRGLTLQVRSGQTVALVGPSGCGKSTTVQLIQRFYDPLSGQVELDGQDIRKLNLRWLRRQIGIVSQEPVLFATTIAENIRYGRDGVTQQDIEKAAMEANAHEFITKLPLKYDTLVGERGAQLSGGQKQRIAIARALVNTPKILLLDEATSALDTESEATVQAALDKAREGRTTIVIAHRLSTVRTADIIVGIKDGVAVEAGTHDELMALGGIYHQLVVSQQSTSKKEHAEEESDDDTEDELLEIGEKAGSQGQLQRTQSSRSATRGSQRLKRAMSAGATSAGSGVETEAGKSDQSKKKNLPKVSFFELLRWNSPEWYFIIIGCFFALVNGGIQPGFAVVFSKILAVFLSCSSTEIRSGADFYSLLFLIIAIVMMIAMLLQPLMFAYSGEHLTLRLRSRAFAAMLRQDITWFDNPDNNTGALTTRLAKETASIQNVTGVRLGSMFQALANMGTAIVIAFINSWQLTLAILAFVPFIGLAGFLEMKILKGGASKDKKIYEDVGKIATEAISNIRTVQSLSREPTFYKMFCAKLDPPYRKELKWSQAVGIIYGFSQAIIFFAYAGLFYLGAYLIDQKELKFEAMMITFSTIMFGAMSLGQAASFAPESGNATDAAGHIKALETAVPQIDAYSADGEQPAAYNATVEFRDVHFHYPNRPTVKVLRGLSVSLSPGQTLALVGSSGCGKSTSVQLLERFYDVDGGHVILDGRDIRALNVAWLRSQIGIVSQEPVLFDCSIAKNIAYGNNACDDVPMADVIAAAKKANIHDFITSLPDGYETNVGSKGTQLSGGQKQRVAIARALLRNPKILLLDEATSALDTESERVVQEALDQARLGRTSIVIAHRLSTVQNADKIAVLRHGQVVETGTHDELVARKGFYYKLLTVQNQKPAT